MTKFNSIILENGTLLKEYIAAVDIVVTKKQSSFRVIISNQKICYVSTTFRFGGMFLLGVQLPLRAASGSLRATVKNIKMEGQIKYRTKKMF